MKTTQLSASNSLENNNSRLFEVFENLDQKIDDLSDESVANLIAAAQLSIKNNHARLMDLNHSRAHNEIDVAKLRVSIEQETHLLAGTVLPLLYKRAEI